MPGWLEVGLAFRGLTLAQRGQLADGIHLIRYSLAEASRTHFVIEQPYFLSHLAKAYGVSGRFDEAFQVINDALERVSSTGERWFEAELHRLKGEFALRKPASDKAMADDCLKRALGVARDQSARWWELRAATQLARLWVEGGERQRAHDLLAPIYDWFTEGFDAPDLQDAKALLEALS
jgi:predicted ATPase